MSTCVLDVRPLVVAQRGDLDFVVEVADVADDGHVLHLAHMLDADHVLVAGRGDEDVGGLATTSSSVTLRSRPSRPAARRSGRLR
jgi:hypothetical protein